MSASINIKPAEVGAKGQQLTQQAATLQSELASVRTIADPSGIFESAAAAQYQAVFEKWATAQTQMLDSLHELGRWLQAAAQALQTTDDELLRSLGLSA
jgi:WXG100 family type VII secretion target